MYDKATVQALYFFSQVPITVLDFQWKLIEKFSKNNRKPSSFEVSKFEELREIIEKKGYGFVHFDDNVPIGIGGLRSEDVIYIGGPVAYGKTDNFESRSFIKKHKIGECPEAQLVSLRVLAEYLSGKKMDDFYADSVSLGDIDSTVEMARATNEGARQRDTFQGNHTYADEVAWLDHIRHGDVEFLESHLFSAVPSHPVILENLKKNEEYMTAIAIGLASRAAVDGGISSAESFRNCDIFLQKLEKCKSVTDILKLNRESQIHFARLVRSRQKNNATNMYVEKAKRYIEIKLFEQISILEVSEAVGISKDYLQKIFKQHEGIPISEYISNVKIEAACDMLRYSDRKIHEIANSLRYGSLSHFSVAFKNKMHISPKEYRDKKGRISF